MLYVLQFNARRSRVVCTRRRVNQYTRNIIDQHTQSLSFIPHSYTQSRTHSYLCGYTRCRSQEKCRSIMAIGLHETHVHMHIHNTYIPFTHRFAHTFIHIHTRIHTTFMHTFILTWIHKVSQPSKMPLHHQTFGHKVVYFF